MNDKPKLIVRQAKLSDVAGILRLSQAVYPQEDAYTAAMIRGQMNHFSDGQLVAIYNGEVVGYCATLRVSETTALSQHTWHEITGGGFGSTHIEKGEFLCGMEVMVHPDHRRLRIGNRLYRMRKQLCRDLRLKGIVIGGRVPLLKKRLKKVGSLENYAKLVRERKLRDPVLSFQLREGFELIGFLPNYLPSDKDSLGYASHMVWYNPEYMIHKSASKIGAARLPAKVRIATVQYLQRSISSFEEFEQIVTYFVDVVADYGTDFVVFPEFITLQLLSIQNEPVPADKAIDHLTGYTERLRTLFSELAIRFNVNIIAGSHATKLVDGSIRNISLACLRDGSIHEQAKIHPTPNERYWWNIEGGHELNVIQTDCGPIGILICYDSEFPELARHLTDQGANIIFVPFCTDVREGYLRVRYSCQARAVENQCYVVMSGNVGNLPRVHNMDIQYAQSCILTPCDFSFARDGIAADTTPNVETVAFADLSISDLVQARQNGTVRNLKDRRHDLYSVVWHKKSGGKSAP